MKPLSSSSTNDSRKSILKNKDPETEQLIPEPPPETEPKKDKSFPVKFATFSDDESNDNGRKPQRKFQSSPLPNKKLPLAPLADLVADFAGQESRGNSEENLLNDTILDHQNANTVLRCSRSNCRLNSPASNSSLLQDSLMSKQRIPVCMCGAVMTRLPASESVGDQTLSTSLTNVSSALNTTAQMETEPTTSASTTEIDKSTDKRKDSFLPPILKQTSDKNHSDSNGKKTATKILVHDDPLSPENLNEDCSPFGGNNSDETKLIQRSSIQRPSDS